MIYQNLQWHPYRQSMVAWLDTDNGETLRIPLVAWAFHGNDLLVLTASGRVSKAEHYDLIYLDK
jgi:hypothetical protein